MGVNVEVGSGVGVGVVVGVEVGSGVSVDVAGGLVGRGVFVGGLGVFDGVEVSTTGEVIVGTLGT